MPSRPVASCLFEVHAPDFRSMGGEGDSSSSFKKKREEQNRGSGTS